MPNKDRRPVSGSLPPLADVRAWEQLVPGTAQLLALEIAQSVKHQRTMEWAKFFVKSTVRISACVVILLVATRHGSAYAVIPAALALVGSQENTSSLLRQRKLACRQLVPPCLLGRQSRSPRGFIYLVQNGVNQLANYIHYFTFDANQEAAARILGSKVSDPQPALVVDIHPADLSDMCLRARVSVNSRVFWLLAESAGGIERLHIRTSWEMA